MTDSSLWQFSLQIIFVLLTMLALVAFAKRHRKRDWPSESERRSFQFPRRTFLILLAVFAVWFGWLTNNARERRTAVAWVEKLRGEVCYDYQMGRNFQFIRSAKPPGSMWLREILGVDFMHDVVRVSLSDTPVSDLAPLKKLDNLEVLYLNGTQGSDLTPLAGLKNLQRLSVVNTQVGDLTPLAGLKKLEWLDLTGTHVSEEQVKTLRQSVPDCKIHWWQP